MVCLAASALCAVLLQSPSLPVAVTQSGLHVQCVDAAVGDREIQTPFGLYRNATDPVVAIEDGAQQVEDLRRLRQDGILDDSTWLQDLSTAGQLEELMRVSRAMLKDEPQRLEPYLVLEHWGRHLDPVPTSIARKDRVAWLWKRAHSKDFATALFAGSRLVVEVSASSQTQHGRVVALSDLRKALRSKDPLIRRIAARVSGMQQEVSLREPLMEASLTDPVEAARDAAAEGVHGINAHASRLYWLRNLARGHANHREHAARNLGRFGGADGLRGLLHVLAAWDSKAGTKFPFHECRIKVVSKIDRNARDLIGLDPEHAEADHTYLRAETEFLRLEGTFEVTRYSEGLHQALLDALDTWAGYRTGRTTTDWLDYYTDAWLPTRL
ncbi:MAG: HEAT repeat domain-containing protein [Planctomycetota bacterium]